jgi:argininosuccinate lyase
MLAAMSGMLGDLRVDKDAMRTAARAGHSTATDLADWLVREAGLPFREAHHTTGQIVKLAERQGCRLDQLDLKAMKEIEGRINSGVFEILSAENSLASRTSFGGAAPNNVRAAIAAAKEKYL